MAQELQSAPQPTGAPSFDKVFLYLKYRKKASVANEPFVEKIDLLAMNVVGEIHYYETVFSPAMSVMMTIVNPNIRTKIFEDYDIRGGERVEFEIKDYLQSTDYLGKDSPDIGFYFTGTVAQVDHYTSNNFAEVFRLRITTEWNFKLGSGVTGVIEGSPSELAKKILKSAYETNKNDFSFYNEALSSGSLYADAASNTLKFNIGTEKKDNTMVLLMSLASRAQYKNNSAGFFFYRNRYGYFFRSIDAIIEDGKRKPLRTSSGAPVKDGSVYANFPVGRVFEYEYNGYNPGAINDVKGAIFTAISFQIQKSDVVLRQQYGLDPLNPDIYVSVDPLKYTGIESKPQFTTSKDIQYLDNIGFTLTSDPKAQSELQSFNTRQIMMGLTPLQKDAENNQVLFYGNNPHTSEAVAGLRYASILETSCTMVVPLNLELVAGTIVRVNINKLIPNQECNIEEEIVPSDYSGLYIIAAVCHAMDRKKGYSSLHLVRDSGKLEKET